MKKILFLSAFLIFFLSGCSQNQTILGPIEEPISEADRDEAPELREEPISEADRDEAPELREEPVSEADRDEAPELREEPVSEADREEPPELREMPVSEADREEPPELEELDIEPEHIGGSCNTISKTSTCIDYIGSFWTETQMRYNCYSGTVSFNLCETGNIGGCNILKGNDTETIIWMYPYGGSPISSDSAQSAKPSCDINPLGNWVNAK